MLYKSPGIDSRSVEADPAHGCCVDTKTDRDVLGDAEKPGARGEYDDDADETVIGRDMGAGIGFRCDADGRRHGGHCEDD